MGLSDGQFNALLGTIGVLGAALIAGLAAVWNARRAANKEAASSGFDQTFQMTKYIREQIAIEVDKQTKPLRDKISALERVVGSLYDLRDAFRDFYREAKAKLGAHTPPLDEKILRQLEETDDDTKTGRMMDEIRESIRQQDETASDVDDSVDIT